MNIFGIGTDIVNVDRVKNSLKNKDFIKRIFNKKEIQKCKKINHSNNCYAKRFAAKEAFSKATGFGISENLHFKNIEIKSNKRGKPSINLNKSTVLFLKKKFGVKSFKTNLSLSDEKNYSIAYVIIEKK